MQLKRILTIKINKCKADVVVQFLTANRCSQWTLSRCKLMKVFLNGEFIVNYSHYYSEL